MKLKITDRDSGMAITYDSLESFAKQRIRDPEAAIGRLLKLLADKGILNPLDVVEVVEGSISRKERYEFTD